jgi:broad specificity phosphatase PhoE
MMTMTTTSWAAPDPGLLRELAEAEEPRTGAGRIIGLRGTEGVTELLFIRHAQMPASTNAKDDLPLTQTGRRQAEVLGAYLAHNAPLTALYSSPLIRTRETADAIAREQSLEIGILDDLREIDTFIPGGVTLRDYLGEEKFLQMQQSFLESRSWDSRGDLYESSASIRGRVVTAIDAAIERHPHGRIAFVTHGPTINAYVASIMQSPIDMLFQPKLTSVSIVLAREERRNLVALNSTPHFGTL